MPPPLPKELRAEVLSLIERKSTSAFIHQTTGISTRQINKMKLNVKLVGTVTPLEAKRGRKRLLSTAIEDDLLYYLNQRSTAYLDEMKWFLYDEYDIVVSRQAISDCLKRRTWSLKKAARRARERNEEQKTAWLRRVRGWRADQMIFLDESAACERTVDRKYGWAPIGHEADVSSPFHRSRRWSILPAYTTEGYIAYMVHHGSITTDIFNNFVQKQVLPKCTPYMLDGPRSIICLDNAQIHMSEELEVMCEAAAVLLARLPPYSCDYNPIETSFAVLKRWIRHNGQLADNYGPAQGGFQQFLYDTVVAQGSRHDPGALFRAAGIEFP